MMIDFKWKCVMCWRKKNGCVPARQAIMFPSISALWYLSFINEWISFLYQNSDENSALSEIILCSNWRMATEMNSGNKWDWEVNFRKREQLWKENENHNCPLFNYRSAIYGMRVLNILQKPIFLLFSPVHSSLFLR